MNLAEKAGDERQRQQGRRQQGTKAKDAKSCASVHPRLVRQDYGSFKMVALLLEGGFGETSELA